ncbi:MAG: hypothetical protein IKR04_06065 [Clostridia bacterium]|nr:hypothetical protein [Clostridia bacterium]
MKKVLIVLSILLILISSTVYADLIIPDYKYEQQEVNNENVEVTICPSRGILFNAVHYMFFNSNYEYVYPISYNGTTYLPVRGLSSLLNEGITWDGKTNSVYIGEGEKDTSFCSETLGPITYPETKKVDAVLNKKITIIYKGNKKTFEDVNGTTVYPISYQGTTYLPVRAVSHLFGVDLSYNSSEDKVELHKAVDYGKPLGKSYDGAKISLSVFYIYREPNTLAEIDFELDKDTIFSAIDYPNGWSRIIYSDRILGWFETKYIIKPDSNANVEEKTAIGKDGEVLVDFIDLKKSQNSESETIDIMIHTDTFTVLDINPGGKWYKVQYGDEEGWIEYNPKYVTIMY